MNMRLNITSESIVSNDLPTDIEGLEVLLGELPPETAIRLREKLSGMMNYRPRIGILGKTGAGKSSLCNALFGQDVAAVNHVEACTRAPQEIHLSLGDKGGITLVDLPGVGESRERDDEYHSLYDEVLPTLDLVLWALKADDRAYSVDEEFYTQVVKPHLDAGKPFFFVLTQADKIEPFREWDIEKHQPGAKQRQNLDVRASYVASSFGVPASRVVAVSAAEQWQLSRLVEEVVFALPNDKKLGFVRQVQKEHVSERTRTEVKRGIGSVIADTLKGAAAGAALGARYAGKVGAFAGAVVGGIGGFFGLW